jgi:hypothetical protein
MSKRVGAFWWKPASCYAKHGPDSKLKDYAAEMPPSRLRPDIG